MDDETIVDNATSEAPVTKPETAVDPAAKVDSLGRSMANKRGRKPGVQYAPVAPGAKPNKAASIVEPLSDENVGKAIAGLFSLISLPLGAHWRLFPQEEGELGRCLGPFARIIGPEAFGHWLTGLTIMPVAMSIIGPRIAIQQAIYKGRVKKDDARPALVNFKAMMAAESVLDMERQVKDAKQYLEQMTKATAEAHLKAATAETPSA